MIKERGTIQSEQRQTLIDYFERAASQMQQDFRELIRVTEEAIEPLHRLEIYMLQTYDVVSRAGIYVSSMEGVRTLLFSNQGLSLMSCF